MRQQLANLSDKDRKTLVVGSLLVGLLIVYQLWSSFDSHVDEMRIRVASQQQTLSWMRQAAAQVKTLRSAQSSGTPPQGKQLLLGLIDRTAKQHSLGEHLQKVQPEGEQGVRVWLQDAQFDHVVTWLDILQHDHGLLIAEISLNGQDSAGVVDLRAFLKAP